MVSADLVSIVAGKEIALRIRARCAAANAIIDGTEQTITSEQSIIAIVQPSAILARPSFDAVQPSKSSAKQ